MLRVLTARWCELDPIEGRRFLLDPATLNVLGWEHEYATVQHLEPARLSRRRSSPGPTAPASVPWQGRPTRTSARSGESDGFDGGDRSGDGASGTGGPTGGRAAGNAACRPADDLRRGSASGWPWSALMIMLAGLLFGYDQGVISGALAASRRTSTSARPCIEVITSWVTLGAMVRRPRGRRPGRPARAPVTILLAAVLFTIGAAHRGVRPGHLRPRASVASWSASASAWPRSPPRSTRRRWLRPGYAGRFVSIYQLAITIGIFIAYLVDYVLSHGERVAGHARCLAIVPGRPAGGGDPAVMSDSPRWYLKERRRDDADRALRKVQGTDDVAELHRASSAGRRRPRTPRAEPRGPTVFARSGAAP